MVQEEKLSEVLSDFARTMVTNFPIERILDRLVERIVEVMPITAAGVTLITDGKAPKYIAASDDEALRFERLQTRIDEGPCLLAFHSGEAVSVPDLTRDHRFPRFAPAALEAGLVAVFTFPLRHGDGRLGALDLYRDSPGDLDRKDMVAAQTLADVAAAYLLNAQARDDARATSDRLHHSSLHDPLTGLPNRLLLQQRIEHAAQRAQRSHTNAAVLFVDIDRFKLVNDTYGHHIGDQLLQAVANRLAGVVRPGDTLARVSGDEFVFLCEDLHSPDDADILARRIDEAFAAPFALADLELAVSVSIGVAFSGPGEQVSGDLVVEADMAMYRAKRSRSADHQILDLRDAARTDDLHQMELDLREALAVDDLQVAYQPIVRSDDGLVTGVEALLRWTHADHGPIPAMAMVQIAEQSALIADIGAWVLTRACHDREAWLHNHPDAPLDVAVNVSARQLMGPDFQGTVTAALADTGMVAGALILEMTENIFIEESERAMTTMAELRQLGVRLALDDFGSGYSSLGYLRRFPVHSIKIDQGFVADIGRSPTAVAVIGAITNMAHVYGLTVTAEGVETTTQRDEVTAAGCEFAQGYYYARPMSSSAIGALLDTQSSDLRLPAGGR